MKVIFCKEEVDLGPYELDMLSLVVFVNEVIKIAHGQHKYNDEHFQLTAIIL